MWLESRLNSVGWSCTGTWSQVINKLLLHTKGTHFTSTKEAAPVVLGVFLFLEHSRRTKRKERREKQIQAQPSKKEVEDLTYYLEIKNMCIWLFHSGSIPCLCSFKNPVVKWDTLAKRSQLNVAWTWRYLG